MTHDELIEAAKQALANTTDFDGDRLASRFADSELADMARAAIRVIAPAVEREALRRATAMSELIASTADEYDPQAIAKETLDAD